MYLCYVKGKVGFKIIGKKRKRSITVSWAKVKSKFEHLTAEINTHYLYIQMFFRYLLNGRHFRLIFFFTDYFIFYRSVELSYQRNHRLLGIAWKSFIYWNRLGRYFCCQSFCTVKFVFVNLVSRLYNRWVTYKICIFLNQRRVY